MAEVSGIFLDETEEIPEKGERQLNNDD